MWAYLRPFVEDYDAAVFTLQAFVLADLGVSRVALIPPAIDPLSSKNDVPGCAAAIQALLADPAQRDAYGAAGCEHIRGQLLLPRLVRDTLALVKSLVEAA